VATGEELLDAVTACYFGPFRCSVMLDANGANTTAAAAVLAAAKELSLSGATALVLAGTGPVGLRISRLLARQGATVKVASRKLDRAEAACQTIRDKVADAKLAPCAALTDADVVAALAGVQVVFAAGAAGVELLSENARKQAKDLRVAIDLNAVPPVGIHGIDVQDKAKDRDGLKCYGAIGVGGTKMKIHRAAIDRLFTANNQVLDAEEIFAIGQSLAK
jgi:NAD(P)-dependent dehydrogenase (short-subunit alcohol dehydrogenase family)